MQRRMLQCSIIKTDRNETKIYTNDVTAQSRREIAQSGESFITPEHRHHIEYGRRNRPSREGRTKRLCNLAELGARFLSVRPHQGFEGSSRPIRRVLETFRQRRQNRLSVSIHQLPGFVIQGERAAGDDEERLTDQLGDRLGPLLERSPWWR